jgi:hypothetical protein
MRSHLFTIWVLESSVIQYGRLNSWERKQHVNRINHFLSRSVAVSGPVRPMRDRFLKAVSPPLTVRSHP